MYLNSCLYFQKDTTREVFSERPYLKVIDYPENYYESSWGEKEGF